MAGNLDADDAIRMRGLLQSVTTYLEVIMEDGIPKPPPSRASRDARCAHAEWIEERLQAIKEAREFLEETQGLASGRP